MGEAGGLKVVNGHDADAPTARADAGCPLTSYQLAILLWVANGKSNLDIASIMGNTTEGAIEQHMYRILDKVSAPTRTAAVVTALRKGWIK